MRWDPNPRFLDELARDPGVRRVCQHKADEALRTAQASARAAGWDEDYIASLDATEASLSTSDPTGHLREWGSKNNPPLAPLRKAVEQVGATWRDDA